MPELPEVETIVRGLRPRLVGRTIKTIAVTHPLLLRDTGSSVLNSFAGKRVVGLRRRGKMILLDCSGGLTLVFHLKMTGQLLFRRQDEPLDKHTHGVISFHSAGHGLRFRDIRKFGFILGVKTAELYRRGELRRLGPEPLELDFASFLSRLEGRRGRLKSLLLNQNMIAGIGNIYADEILFEARLHPLTQVARLRRPKLLKLWAAVSVILRKAVFFRGTSVRDYRDGNGLEGSFQNHLRVYGREGLPCLSCGTPVRRLVLGGRSSFFCPRCQRKPRPH
ncbi:MAG: bifunctional DNA-formamidopyrimidine glycosylase/DNA-(apurinic or apyrimidinic site) lyase [Acidobacteriota bacterium]